MLVIIEQIYNVMQVKVPIHIYMQHKQSCVEVQVNLNSNNAVPKVTTSHQALCGLSHIVSIYAYTVTHTHTKYTYIGHIALTL